MEKLAIEGLNYHWGRNQNHFVAKDVKIIGESYEFYTNAVNTKENAMDDINLVYNTNGNWKRSGNPGSVKDPMTAVGNIISREAVCYNVGYIYSLDWYEFNKKQNWEFQTEDKEDEEFKETAAHEIGHEILKKYGGTIYSYGHKGSAHPIFQYKYDDAPSYPKNGEIDIMPYYTGWLDYSQKKRMVASEKDVLGLLWLSKIEIR